MLLKCRRIKEVNPSAELDFFRQVFNILEYYSGSMYLLEAFA